MSIEGFTCEQLADRDANNVFVRIVPLNDALPNWYGLHSRQTPRLPPAVAPMPD